MKATFLLYIYIYILSSFILAFQGHLLKISCLALVLLHRDKCNWLSLSLQFFCLSVSWMQLILQLSSCLPRPPILILYASIWGQTDCAAFFFALWSSTSLSPLAKVSLFNLKLTLSAVFDLYGCWVNSILHMLGGSLQLCNICIWCFVWISHRGSWRGGFVALCCFESSLVEFILWNKIFLSPYNL